jgi:hypothetical protein
MVKHFLLNCCFLILPFLLFGQAPKVRNLPDFDQKWVHFGFSLGVTTTNFAMQSDIRRNDTMSAIFIEPQSGFSLGIVSDLHLNKNLNLRFIPSLSFGQRNIEYSFESAVTNDRFGITKSIESTYIDFPLNIKFATDRYNNFAAYVVGGAQYSIDLVSQKDVSNLAKNFNNIIVIVDESTISGQLGFGFDFYLEYFKFSPELKVSYGINNVLFQDNTVFSDPISRLRSRIFQISFTFEG